MRGLVGCCLGMSELVLFFFFFLFLVPVLVLVLLGLGLRSMGWVGLGVCGVRCMVASDPLARHARGLAVL